jgi:hypothetical protein
MNEGCPIISIMELKPTTPGPKKATNTSYDGNSTSVFGKANQNSGSEKILTTGAV